MTYGSESECATHYTTAPHVVCLTGQCWYRWVPCYSFCTPPISMMSLIEDNGFSLHLYADDTQVYDSCQPVQIDAFSAKLFKCIRVVSNWMRSNRLQLNSDKTEVL